MSVVDSRVTRAERLDAGWSLDARAFARSVSDDPFLSAYAALRRGLGGDLPSGLDGPTSRLLELLQALMQGDTDRANRRIRERPEALRELADISPVLAWEWRWAVARAVLREGDAAGTFVRCAGLARDLEDEAPTAACSGRAAIYAADVACANGRHPEAIATLRALLPTFERLPGLLPSAWAHLATALRDHGSRGPAHEAFDRAAEIARAHGTGIIEARIAVHHARLYSYRLDADDTAALPLFEERLRRAIHLAEIGGNERIAYEARDMWVETLLRIGLQDEAESRATEFRAVTPTSVRTDLQSSLARQAAQWRETMVEALYAGCQRNPLPTAIFRRADPSDDYRAIFVNDAVRVFLEHDGHQLHLVSEMSDLPFGRGLHEALDAAMEGRTHLDEIVVCGRIHRRRVAPADSDVFLTLEDVHDLRETECREVGLRIEAERTAASRTEFLAHMSHEVRTPLSGVLGLADLLAGTALTPAQREIVEGIRASGSLLRRVVNDVLDLTKIESAGIEIRPRATDVRALVRDVLDLCAGTAAVKGVRLTSEFAPEVAPAYALDADRCRQVLGNLVGNALRHTSVGEVTVAVREREGWFHVEVRDQGPGVPEELRDRIFEPFHSGQGGATGLGLTIARRIVVASGGQIGFQNRPEGGAAFWVEVPAVREEIAVAPEIERVALPERFRALLVEDERVNALVARRLLEDLGGEVDHAESGEAALERAARHGYDVILLDVRLPGMDGLEVARRLRACGDTTPLIAMTAGTFQTERDAAAAAGMGGFVAKPIEKIRLVEALRDALG